MSELNNIIPPEIYEDNFYHDIVDIVSRLPNNSNILEIGSSSGDGSTSAFVEGILKNPNKINLFCLEISKQRFEILKNRFNYPWFYPYNMSSININEFKSIDYLINDASYFLLNKWLRQDIQYIKDNNIKCDAINFIKKNHHIKYFDCVLIDGSAFTAEAEFKKIYGSKIIMLDDVIDIKNEKNHKTLLSDKKYSMLKFDITRNGYSIFTKNKHMIFDLLKKIIKL